MPQGVRKTQKGFTILEIILTVAVIAIMATIVFMSISPAKQVAKSRNIDRKTAVSTIYDGMYQYWLIQGSFPAGLTTTPTEICRTNAPDCTGLLDLTVLTESGGYMHEIPLDPICATENSTGYSAHTSQGIGGFLIVQAPCAEADMLIHKPAEWIEGGLGDSCGSRFIIGDMEAQNADGDMVPVFDVSGNLDPTLQIPNYFLFNDPTQSGAGIGNVAGGTTSVLGFQSAINSSLSQGTATLLWVHETRTLTLSFDTQTPVVASGGQAITGGMFIEVLDELSTITTNFFDLTLDELGSCSVEPE